MSKVKLALSFLVFLGFMLVAWHGFDHDPYELNHEVKGLHLRHLHHQASDGRVLDYSDYKGQWVYVNVWASWCPTCLAHWDDSLDTHRLKSIGVVMKDNDAKSWLDEHPLSWPQLISDTSTLLLDLGVVSAPESFLVNPDGDVVHHWYGPVSQSAFDEVYNAAIF